MLRHTLHFVPQKSTFPALTVVPTNLHKCPNMQVQVSNGTIFGVLSNQTKSQIVCHCCKTFAVIYISTPPLLFPREFHSIVKALKVCVPFDCVLSCHCTFWHACDRYLPHIVFNQCVLCMFRNYFYIEIYIFLNKFVCCNILYFYWLLYYSNGVKKWIVLQCFF